MRIFLILFTCVALLSCGSSNNISRVSKSSIKGVWVLEDVDFNPDSVEKYNLTFFDDIPLQCLEYTNWEFTAGNNSGSYALSGSSCNKKGIYNFRWSIPKELYAFENSIMLKPAYEEMKSEINTNEYRMQLSDINKDRMRWNYDMFVDGKKFRITLNFYKA